MLSEQENNQRQATDEIDLRGLIFTLWASKSLVIVIALLVSCAAAAYAYLSTPVYEVRVQALPPTPAGLADYNMANQLSGSATVGLTRRQEKPQRPDQKQDADNAIEALTPDDAYKVFLRHVDSNRLRRKFFDQYYLGSHSNTVEEAERQQLWNRFNQALNIKRPQNATDRPLMTLTLQGIDPQTIAQWANQYVSMAMTAAQQELLQNLHQALQLRLHSTQAQIDTLHEVAAIKHKGQIAQLTEALQLAESIGLQEPSQTGNLITSYTGSTTYMRGAKALHSELKLMEQRRDLTPYIDELPKVLRTQALLQGIDTAPNVSVAVIDENAAASVTPIKPRKALILALGIIVGGMLGVLAALICALFKSNALTSPQ